MKKWIIVCRRLLLQRKSWITKKNWKTFQFRFRSLHVFTFRGERFFVGFFPLFFEMHFGICWRTTSPGLWPLADGRRGALVARAHLHLVVTLFALDVAAPVKLAPTALLAWLPSGGVAPVAAHQLAAVDARTPLWKAITRFMDDSGLASRFQLTRKILPGRTPCRGFRGTLFSRQTRSSPMKP